MIGARVSWTATPRRTDETRHSLTVPFHRYLIDRVAAYALSEASARMSKEGVQ